MTPGRPGGAVARGPRRSPLPSPATSPRTSLVLAPLLAVLLVLPGCRAPAASTGDGEPVDRVRIGLTEWSVETAGARADVGEVTLVVTNTGATGHDVVVHGREGTWGTPVLDPGETYEVVIRTTAGETLELVCTVTGHHAAGMHTTLPVVDADGTGGSSTDGSSTDGSSTSGPGDV